MVRRVIDSDNSCLFNAVSALACKASRADMVLCSRSSLWHHLGMIVLCVFGCVVCVCLDEGVVCVCWHHLGMKVLCVCLDVLCVCLDEYVVCVLAPSGVEGVVCVFG